MQSRAAEAMTGLRGCTSWCEPSLLAYGISTKITKHLLTIT